MNRPAIIDRWYSLTPAERDMWVQRTVFAERPMDRTSGYRYTCPACNYDGVWDGYWGDCQPYTQHPAAAWMVVERMQERGWIVEIILQLQYARVCYQQAPERFGHKRIIGEAATADKTAAAICLAALLALAGEGNDRDA